MAALDPNQITSPLHNAGSQSSPTSPEARVALAMHGGGGAGEVEEHQSDWGLLSVADILETEKEKQADMGETDGGGIRRGPRVDELQVPLLRCTAAEITKYATALVEVIAEDIRRNTGALEELFTARTAALRRSLEAAQAINSRLVTVAASLSADDVHASTAVSLLRTIVVFCSAADSSKEELLFVFMQSMQLVDWKLATPSECAEILQALKQLFFRADLPPPLQSEYLSAEMTLAIRSGTLNAVSDCLLAPNATAALEKLFFPPAGEATTTFLSTSTDAFLTRAFDVPRTVADGHATSRNSYVRKIFLCGGIWLITKKSKVFRYDVKGLMGTRIYPRSEYTIGTASLREDESTVILADSLPNSVLIIQPDATTWRSQHGNFSSGGGCLSATFLIERRQVCASRSSAESATLQVASGLSPEANKKSRNSPGRGGVAPLQRHHLAASTGSLHFIFEEKSACRKHFYFSLVAGEILNILVVLAPQLPSAGRCVVLTTRLSEVFSSRKPLSFSVPYAAPHAASSASPAILRRVPRASKAQHKFMYFTKGSGVGVGRASLKQSFQPFTIECWVYPCAVSEHQTILSIGDKTVDEVFVEICPSSSGSVLWQAGARTPQLGSSCVTFESPGKLTVCQRWWHVALVFSGSKWELWLNDAIVAVADAIVSPLAISNSPCIIGKQFVGLVLEVRIWDHRRLPADLHRDARRSLKGDEMGLTGYFPLDEQCGNVIADYSKLEGHALVSPKVPLRWSTVDTYPVAAPEGTRFVNDFVPIAIHAQSGSPHAVKFASCESHHALAVAFPESSAVFLFEYTTDTLLLAAQTTLTLPASTSFLDIAYHDERCSIQVFAMKNDSKGRILSWELHRQSQLPIVPHMGYSTVWACGREMLKRCAEYAARVIGAEKCLVDQATWSTRIPSLIVDSSEGVIASLLLVAEKAVLEYFDFEVVSHISTLIGANLFFHCARGDEAYARRELGDRFSDCFAMITEAERLQGAENRMRSPRHLLLWLAFQPELWDTSLLRLCICHLIDEQARIQFLAKRRAKTRLGHREVLVFDAVVSFYGSLQRVNAMVSNTSEFEKVTQVTSSLMQEALFQFEQLIAAEPHSTIGDERNAASDVGTVLACAKRATMTLEVFQEMLFATIAEDETSPRITAGSGRAGSNQLPRLSTSDHGGQSQGATKALKAGPGLEAARGDTGRRGSIPRSTVNVLMVNSYSKMLLKVCERALNVAIKAVRKARQQSDTPYPSTPRSCDRVATITAHLKETVVGALLPSFTIMLPLLPSTTLSHLSQYVISCRDALVSLVEALPGASDWISELASAITFSLGKIGCSIVVSADVLAPPLSESTGYLFRGGLRKSNSARDVAIMNIQLGVGSASKVFEDLDREAMSLRVVKDAQVLRVERHLLAAYSSVLLPTTTLVRATKDGLRDVFQTVRKLRPWLLSQRQEDPQNLMVIEERAAFLSRFEPCNALDDAPIPLVEPHRARGEVRSVTTSAAAAVATGDAAAGHKPSGSLNGANSSGILSSSKQWRRMFQSWKTLRNLKAMMVLLSSGTPLSATDTGTLATTFIQTKNPSCREIEQYIEMRTEKAKNRLTGLSLLRQLIAEANVSEIQRRLVYPVMVKAFAGWHYAEGIEGCSGETLFRIRTAFFELLDTVLKHYNAAQGRSGVRHLCGELVLAMINAPWQASDLEKMPPNTAETLRSMWSLENREHIGRPRLNGDIPDHLRRVVLTQASAAPTLLVGSTGLTLRGLGSRGSCVAPCRWFLEEGRQQATFYFEALVIEMGVACSCYIGVAQPTFSYSRPPGWDPGSFALQLEEGLLFSESSTGKAVGTVISTGDVVGCGWTLSDTLSEIFWTKNGRRINATANATEFTEFCPVAGMEGLGIMQFNFGTTPFLYTQLPPSRKGKKRKLGDEAWEVFRFFSMRSVLCAVELGNGSAQLAPGSVEREDEDGGGNTSPVSPKAQREARRGCVYSSVVKVVTQCLEALGAEIERSLLIPSAEFYVITICSHMTVLAKLLFTLSAPFLRKNEHALCTVMQRAVDIALHPSSSCPPSIKGVLLAAWAMLMHQNPPTEAEASWNTASTHVISTLLGLCTVEVSDSWMKPPTANPHVWADGVAWTALSILQFINSHPHHSWSRVLHQWLMSNLGRKTDDGLLALHVLEGFPRLVVGGDEITVRQRKQVTSRALMVSYALQDEVCTVLDPQSGTKFLSMTHVSLLFEPEEPFPARGNAHHHEQAQCILEVARREWGAHGSLNRELASSMCFQVTLTVRQLSFTARLARTVWRCSVAGFDIPTEIISALAAFSCVADVSDAVVKVEKLMLTELLAQCCLLGMWGGGLFSERLPPQPLHMLSSDQEEFRGAEGEGHAQILYDLTSRGFGVDAVLAALGTSRFNELTALRVLSELRSTSNLAWSPVESGQPRSDSASFEAGASSESYSQQVEDMGVSGSPLLGREIREPLDTSSGGEGGGGPLWHDRPFDDLRSHSVGLGPEDDSDLFLPLPSRHERLTGGGIRDDGESPHSGGSRLGMPFRRISEAEEPPFLDDDEDELDEDDENDDETDGEEMSEDDTSDGDGAHHGEGDCNQDGDVEGEREGRSDLYYGIRLVNGYISVSGTAPVGHSFTIDLLVRPFTLDEPQYLMYQRGANSSALLLELSNGRLLFGWVAWHEDTIVDSMKRLVGVDMREIAEHTWIRLTCVQRVDILQVYVDGELRGQVPCPVAGCLLQDALFLGGVPHLTSNRFRGDFRRVRIVDAALSEKTISELGLEAAEMAFDNADLVTIFRCEARRIDTSRRMAGERPQLVVTPVGDIVWLQPSRVTGNLRPAIQSEIDFTAQADDQDLFVVDVLQDADNSVSGWRELREQSAIEQLRRLVSTEKHLIGYYTSSVLLRALPTLTEREISSICDENVRRVVRLAVMQGNPELLALLTAALQHCIKTNRASHFVSESVDELLRVAQKSHRTLTFESPHPSKSLVEPLREVKVPGQSMYEVHFDQRCTPTSMLVTFYRDPSLSSVIAQVPGYALTPLEIRASGFFFDVRIESMVEQWGYKVVIVYDAVQQLAAARMIRCVLSTALHNASSELPAVFTSRACIDQMAAAVSANTGKCRRVLLSCITDLLLSAENYQSDPPDLSSLHEMRRMAERQYRRKANLHLHCRFVQVVTEFYVALRSAELLWSIGTKSLEAHRNSDTPLLTDTERFARARKQQRKLYKSRCVGERVYVEKHRLPTNLQVEMNADHTFLIWSERAGSSFIALAAVTRGRWYFEVKMAAAGDVLIGVIPFKGGENPQGDHAGDERAFIAYNGKTGQASGGREEDCPEGTQRIWKSKDVVGVIIDGDERTISFTVNGLLASVVISFAHLASDSPAASAASPGPGHRGNGVEDSGSDGDTPAPVVEFYPYFVMGSGEGVGINFGGTYFDFDIPQKTLPLDSINLSLGTLIPYNHIRAFCDVAAFMMCDGGGSPPAFIHDEEDPFEKKGDRQGPQLVSVDADEDVTVSQLVARNAGVRFSSARANCSVSGGKWYYEVTLLSQGLMQIGWASADHFQEGTVGDTPTSWAVDLFRRVKWHNGRSEALPTVRRWVYGDVIGCAIDIDNRRIFFSCNGRHVGDVLLGDSVFQGVPGGLRFAPAVSLRCGNSVVFNFGSSAFKYKPDGYLALGVPDSWNERIDTYYSAMGPETVLRSLQALRTNRLTLEWRIDAGALTGARASKYLEVVKRVDSYCQERNRSHQDITENIITEIFSDYTDHAEVWEAFTVLMAFARIAEWVIPFINITMSHKTFTTTFLLACKPLLFTTVRSTVCAAVLKETNCRSERFRIVVSRSKARADRKSLAMSVFGQTFDLIADQHPRIFRTNKRFWSVSFIGEGAEDVGGPYREHLSEICQELMTPALQLFVPTGNNVHNTGTHRDALVPASLATSPQQLAMFTFIGQIMGGAMRSAEPLNIILPPLFWKLVGNYSVTENDLDDVDRICLQCVREFRNMRQTTTREVFEETFDSETFVTRLSDGTTKELVENGASIRVTYDNCEEYADRLASVRLNEFRLQASKVSEGLLAVVPGLAIALLSPAELESMICGKPDYTVEELKNGASFEGVSADDRRVGFLWQALGDATPLQRRLFLRFVSGRERMPVKLRVLPIVSQSDPDTLLPRAATCFFAIELPDYSTVDNMKEKLFYTIENCLDIDTDFYARDTDETTPQLLVGVDDGRLDESEAVPVQSE